MKVFTSPSSVILMGSILASSSMLVGCGSDSDDTSAPATPSTSVPLTPLTPATPEQPVTPEQPENPSTPLTPLTPATPTNPETPTAPIIPVIPTTPLTPLTPATPVKPSTPLTPLTPATPVKPSTPLTPLTPATPIKPSTPPVTNGPLVDTAILPNMPVNSQPLSLAGDAAAISAFSTGVYTTSNLRIIGMGNQTIDCPAQGNTNTTTCPGIVKYQLDQNNKLIVSGWAYMPISKKWIQLSEKTGVFDRSFGFGDLYYDGSNWSKSNFELAKMSARTTPTTLSYNLGRTELSIIGHVAAPSPASQSVMGGVGYSSNAKALSYRVAITQGEYMTLKKAGFWKKADDGNTYQSLAAFRAAHTQKTQPLCLTVDTSDQGVVFNPNQVGAQFVKLNGICALQLDERVAAVNTEEGVKTLAGRQVIYLGQDPKARTSNNSSESQFLWALALTDAGTPAQGKAYQKGYVSNVSDEFYNEAAILDWLKAKHGYNASLALPQ